MRSLGRNWDLRSPKSYRELSERPVPTNPALEAERQRRQQELHQPPVQKEKEALSAEG